MGMALRELVAEDSSFGPGHVFSELLVLERIDSAAGTGIGTATPGRVLTPDERDAIERSVAGFGTVRWIEDPEEHLNEDRAPIPVGAAFVGVGEVVFDDDGALVPVSLWCGGLCGIWLTYRIRLVGGEWTVVGPEGPVSIE